MPRRTNEWIGRTDDTPIPPRVRLRVFERHGGVCQISGRKIQAGDQWDVDHRVPLVMGGEHRESNLQPALRSAHREKTRADVKAKAKAARTRKKHLGLSRSKNPIPGSRNTPFKRKVSGRTEVR